MVKVDRRLLVAMLSGFLYSASWLCFADGFTIAARDAVVNVTSTDGSWKLEHNAPYVFLMWVPVLVGTLAMLMLNMVGPSDLNDSDSFLEERDTLLNKGWFFFSVLVTMVSIIVAVLVFVGTYSKLPGDLQAPGVNALLTPIIMAMSSAALFVSRGKKSEDEF
eukprot:TRINITY_DN29930_c0_g1_i1.p1 TRINITY_DN29930_c0_g1~~TRINITY_DN29930_c0_g1_i1.p1  ORF type:complete len:163 (+),score=51.95 TRINITY_DN29930_c0_g1_i1:55-543(+)